MQTDLLKLQQDSTLQAIKQRLIQAYSPLRMFLFGSRAAGTHRADSDYDILLVVRETTLSRLDNMLRSREVLFDLDISVDVFVYSEKEFEEWKNELNSVAEAAHNLGMEIPLG